MNDTTERILIDALDLLEQGVGVDEIVARYPAQAAELRPFLLTADALSNLAHQPTLTAQAQSKRAFLDAADHAAVENAKPHRVAGGWMRRLVAPALAVLLVMFLGGAGLVNASGSAVPGDALYQTKLWAEEVRLNLTANPEAAAELREQFRQERISEIEQLLAEGRAAAVSLSGEIDAMDGERWSVAGVPVLVASATAIDGLPVVGALAQVDGLTGDQAVIASRVIILAAGPPLEPEETKTPAPSPSPTPRPSMTTPAGDNDNDDEDNDNGDDAPVVPPPGSQPSAPTAAPIMTPTSAPPAPTAAPSLPPTATPDDDDDNNDNDDDDDNDNDDNDNADNDNADNDNVDNDNVDDNGSSDDDGGSDNSGSDTGGSNDNGDDSDSSGSGGGDDDDASEDDASDDDDNANDNDSDDGDDNDNDTSGDDGDD